MLEIASVFDDSSTKHVATSHDQDGLTALHLAAGRGDLAKVKKLIQNGDDIFSLDSRMGISILHKAIYSGNPEVVEFLLQQGALIDLQSPSNGNTPLHDAIYFKSGNDLRVIRAILAHQPNIAIKNRAGLAPLDSAKVLKDDDVIRVLQEYIQSKISLVGQELMKAVRANQIDLVAELIKNSKVNIEEADEQGFTPLLWASREGFVPIVKLLLEKGADPNHEDQWMHANAGHKAAFWGHAEVMSLLVKHGLNINALIGLFDQNLIKGLALQILFNRRQPIGMGMSRENVENIQCFTHYTLLVPVRC